MARTAALPRGNRFGKYLARLRKKLSLTQAAVGTQIGCSTMYISRLETGHSGAPNAISLIRLADALDVPLSVLLVKGGMVEKCRHPEHLDAAITAFDGWQRVLDITESARVLQETVRILCDNDKEVSPDYRHLLKPLKLHSERLRAKLRVTIDAHPID